jgi:hypothetical protein
VPRCLVGIYEITALIQKVLLYDCNGCLLTDMPFETSSLIREIYRQAMLNKLAPPAVTRIVKLIYLADIEWRKRHDGQPLGDLTWRFLHYGPYAVELAAPLGGPDTEIREIRQGITARTFSFSPDELSGTSVPEELSNMISSLVKRWGGADLNILLDHVYFDTEPMENAQRGELLDFSTLRSVSFADRPIAINQDKLKQIRAKIKERTRALALTRAGIN